MPNYVKPSKLVVASNSSLANLFICQTFFCQTLEKSKFIKHSLCQTFPLYGMYIYVYGIIHNSYCVYMQRLSKTELEQLDDWYQLINPSRMDSEE